MANYSVLPLTDSFSVQRCLTWAQQVPLQSAVHQRPVSAPVVQRLQAQTNDRKPVLLRPTESSVSKKAPYAPRLIDSHFYSPGPLPVGGASTNVGGYRGVQRPYSALNDPHLYDYYVRKFVAVEPLQPTKPRDNADKKDESISSSKKRSGSKTKKSKNGSTVAYKVAVKTGDRKHAETKAKIFITIIGTKGKLPKRHLVKKTANSKKQEFEFKRGSTHVFKFDGQNIGNVESIIVEHDGVLEADGWFLEQIEINKKSPSTGQEKSWIFPCENWLSLYEGDCEVRRQLYVQRSSNSEYEVVTVTGNMKGAGTDANVYVTLFGKTGQTSKLQLQNSNNDSLFERNQSDTFVFKAKCCGPLTKIRIQHDNTGFAPGWFLERVVVTDLKNPRWKYYFPCGQWLAKDEGDGLICRDLIGSQDPLGVRKMNKYKITVFTGNKRGAGTDANVTVTLFGELGDSAERKLDTKRKNNFESGQKDEFVIESPSLGKLNRLRIGHDNSGLSPGWFLDKVIVDDLEANRVYEFPCQRWLAKDEDDGQLSRDLVCGRGSDGAIPYTMRVKTGDVTNAGTSAGVYTVLYGGKDGDRSSGKIPLTNGKFERGRTDTFNFDVGEMLSPLSRIDIGHDNKGPGPGWFLDEVVVQCLSAGIEQTFKCNKWLSLDEGDRMIERTLFESGRKNKEKMDIWQVSVYTADERSAGTDASVLLTIYGKNPEGLSIKSDEVLLENKGDNFETGQVDQFKIETIEVGKPYKIRVSHDNAGSFPGWKLDRIKLENLTTNKHYTFNCNRWLAEDEDDGSIVREIPAEGDGIKWPQPVVKYKVKVHTGKKMGSGTDANVFLNIFGGQGDTGERSLTKSSTNKNKFEKGNVDEFVIEAVTLKKLSKIRIGHDGSKPGSGWFLDKVVVQSPEDPSTSTVFECNRWLDIKEDDGLIVREITAGGSQMLSTTTYHVSVKTGTVRYAGTDANVFVKVFGTKGDTGNLKLASAENTKNKFEVGRTDDFRLEATDIGQLTKLRIGHDGTSPGSGWFLDEVVVDVPSKGEKYTFACHRWLDKNENDGQIELEMEPTSVEKGAIRIPYEVTVWTGDVKGAGTDANVFIQMYGELGKTEEYKLRNRTDNFEQGHVDKFKIEASDVGPLLKVRAGHDGKGAFAGWFLEKMLIQRHPTKISKRRLKRRRSADQRNVEHDDNCRRSLSGHRRFEEGSDSDGGMSVRSHRKKFEGLEEQLVGNGRRPSSTASIHRYDHNAQSGRKGSNARRHDDSDSDDKTSASRRKGLISRRKDDSDSDDKSSASRRKGSISRRKNDSDSDEKSSAAKRKDSNGRGHRDYDSDEKSYPSKGKGSSSRGYDDSDSDSRSVHSRHARRGNKENVKSHDKKTKKQHSRDSDDEYLSKPKLDKDNRGRRGSTSHLDENKHNQKHSKGKADDDAQIEEVEEYWFVCKKWFDKSEGDGKIVRELLPTTEDGQPLDVGLSEIEYVVKVYTGDKFGAGTDANVYINITGEFGDTGERHLDKSNSINKFERNKEDVFKVSAVELGKLRKLKIRHDNKGGGAAWYLDRVEVEDTKNNKNYLFVCQHWLATDKDDGQIARELVPHNPRRKASMKEVALEDKALKTTYHVFVYTGDKFGAGTDASVYITLFGEIDDTGQVFLKSSKNNKNKFERNQMDEFVVEAVDIGELKKIKIGHDNAGGGGGAWYLDRVEIDCPHLGRKWLFPHKRWLAKDQDDGKIERELFPQEMSTEEYKPCVPYEITTFTSDISGAGSSADVYIVLYGRDICTSKKSLCPNKNDRKKVFDRAKESAFVLELEEIPGEIEKIRIGHDGKGFGAGWHLEKVEIRRLKSSGKGSETYIFPCKRWLAKDEDDGAIERELVADKVVDETVRKDGTSSKKELQRQNTLTAKKYVVNVVTGDVRSAGTDANVFLTITGTNGDSGERQLIKSETNRNKFERNQTDRFLIEAVDLGELCKVKIRHDDTNLSSDWFLERIEVIDPDRPEPYMFHCERWLAKKKDDGKIERTIFAKGYRGDMNSNSAMHSRAMTSIASIDSMKSSEAFGKNARVIKRHLSMEDIPEGPTIPYTVKITTGKEKKMGTESNVYIKILGTKKKHTGKQFLELTTKKGFTPGSVEVFSLECVDVGDVTQIELGHDGVTDDSGWFVQQVEVDLPTKGKNYLFKCNSWLAKEKGDGLTSRFFELEGGEASVVSYKPRIPYEVTFFTGDVAEAGTDSEIFIKVFGVKGSSSDIVIPKMNERFERGRTDLIKLEIEDVTPITILRVGHDGKGSRPTWFLDKVEMRNMTTGDLAVFKVNAWLSKTKDDKKLVRDVPATVKGKDVVKQTSYKVSVQTSNINGAGTDAGVYITLFGERGDSGELHLKDSETNKKPFENNQLDVFQLPSILDLGQLFKIRIWHDNKGFGAAWHLAHVEVENASTGVKYMFLCNRWLSMKDDDKQICREITCSNLPSPKVHGKMTYQIDVITSDVKDADSLHNVWIKLVGDLKESDDFVLQNSARRPLLRRGQMDSEKMESRNLGNLVKCYLGLVKNGNVATTAKDATWHCDRVIVCNVETGDRYTFVCNDWLKVHADMTQRTAKLLKLEAVEESHLTAVKSLDNVKYDIAVHTGNEMGSGTNANVSITIYGTNGDTGKRPLTQKFRDLFERGQKDNFQIETVDLGDISKIKIEHDNSGFRPGWLLDRVEVTNMTTNHKWIFPCSSWLDKSKGDGQIARELLPRN